MRFASSIACLLATWVPVAAPPDGDGSPCSLILLDRQIAQFGSRWAVRYRVRYEGAVEVELSASDLNVDYEAWVSNSRAKPHITPRKSQARFAVSETNALQTSVIASSNDRQRCRERIAVALSSTECTATDWTSNKTSFLPMRLEPGQIFWVHLSLEHEHFLYGSYDPLLGDRKLELQIGPCRLLDTIPLNTEQAPAVPLVKLSAPPKERLDQRQFRSAPDSLYLAADVPGYQYFRFDDMPVRYGTPFRLSFWYLVAVGTEGTCHVRIMEYQDTPTAWCRLDGGFDEQVTEQGRWRRFEQVFQTRDETTTMALDFRIVGANVGELWIDDIELVPLNADPCEDRGSRTRVHSTAKHNDTPPQTATKNLASDRR